MGLSFRKRVRLFPGFYVNVSKSGTSLSVGPRGAKVNFGKRGVTLHTSVPGTGIYYRETLVKRRQSRPKANSVPEKEPLPPFSAVAVLAVSIGLSFHILLNDFSHFWVALILLSIGIPLGFWLLVRNIK